MFTFKVLNLFRKNFGRWVATTASRPRPRPSFRPRLEWLEDRLTPGGGGGNTDNLVWKPQNNSQDPSLSANWFDQNQGKSGVTIPSASNPVIFDGSVSNSPITWGAMTVKSMTLQNGYNALMTENSNTTDAGAFNEGATEKLNMYFNNNMVFNIGGGGVITNMVLAGYPTGQFKLTGGTMEIAQSSSYQETTGVNIVVGQGATLTDQSWCPLKFTNSKLYLTVNGMMNVFYGTGGGMTIIDRNGFSQDVIDVSGGTLAYLGNGGVSDTFDMNVRVEAGGVFEVASAGGAKSGGSLTLKGDPSYLSLYLTGPSSVELSNAATLECDNGYLEDSGTLETTDSTTCTLKIASDGSGTANITGGQVIVDDGAGFGTLNISCATLNFAGTLWIGIEGDSFGECDHFNVTGNLNLQNGSTLKVFVDGGLIGGNQWVIISANNAFNAQTNNFTSTNLNDLGLHANLNNPKAGYYMLSL